MARLTNSEKTRRTRQILEAIAACYGITEAEIVSEVGLGRRTVNNYLRSLEGRSEIYKVGRLWYKEGG
ncbi:MAG: winged helix-turn-helix domain-containing protein [Gammaproteobacteria bacterium]|nr:winged helix-turn-helix domain-containing protein [Gammaproteobacteria bacterium]